MTVGEKLDCEHEIGRRIRLRDLHIFLTVSQRGSMAQAAHQLAMTQPAVSGAIANLEHILRVRLLDRNPQEARTALEALVAGPLSCAPTETPEGKRYAITGQIAVGSLFTIDSVPRGNFPLRMACA